MRVVMKFGGTSVASVERWGTIASVLGARLRSGESVTVVASALAGVSDRLAALPEMALSGAADPALDEIEGLHRKLSEDGGIDGSALLAAEFDTLRRLAAGIPLVGEVTPRVRAEILAQGELMSTRLGAELLRRSGVPVAWVDARTVLTSVAVPGRDPRARYLDAICEPAPDSATPGLLRAPDGGIALTQGFIARDPAGDTVLLGRGGSDVSAAYLAAKVGAGRLEIWTDVPGMFTADPAVVPGARLIRRLGYEEAQEIASAGGAILHPRCLPALRDAGIPVELRSTLAPDDGGTRIERGAEADVARLKAVSAKKGVVLVSMDTVGMWQQVGFLASAFDCFRRHGLSVDLVSTSETVVTASLDRAANDLLPETLEALERDLSDFCTVRVIERCAGVTLVGRRIRALLHRLAPALELFEESEVHLVSQAANDLNVTFVVEEEEADRLVRRLHDLFFGAEAGPLPWLGRTWGETGGAPQTEGGRLSPWWERRRDELLQIADELPAAYVYALDEVRSAAGEVRELAGVDRAFYAMKANAHPEVLRAVVESGLGLECVSPGELHAARAALPELRAEDILFTPNFVGREEYELALDLGASVTLDSHFPLTEWPELFRGRDVLLRVDPGAGRGHHEKVRTGGSRAKFGIAARDLAEAAEAAGAVGARVIGLHAHAGSGILDAEHWARTAEFLESEAERFPDARIVNVGGGLGVPDRVGGAPLDMGRLGEGLARIRAVGAAREIWIEPGRFLVAGAGVLVARVTQVKRKGDAAYVGIAAGMNALLRPALYGAHHEIVNLTRMGEEASEVVTVVGPICESGDRLGIDRWMPRTRAGDVLLIADCGAYGRVMASEYNGRPPPPEVIV